MYKWKMLSTIGFDKYDQRTLPLALISPYYAEEGNVYFSCDDDVLNNENIETIKKDFQCGLSIDQENNIIILEDARELS